MKQFHFLLLLLSLFLVVFSCSQVYEENSTKEDVNAESLEDIINSEIIASSSDTLPNPPVKDERNNTLADKPQNTPKPTSITSNSSTSNSAHPYFSGLGGSGAGLSDESNDDWSTGTGHAPLESTRTRLNGVNLEHLDIEETGKIFLRLEVDASGNVLRGNCVMSETTINDTEFILKVIDAVIDQVKYKKMLDGKTTFELYTVYLKKKK
jgi:hypothetical protein